MSYEAAHHANYLSSRAGLKLCFHVCFRHACSYGVYGERQLGWAANEQDANDTTGMQNFTGRLREAMLYHRQSFIQESDFALMADYGINCVRIPVGFWLFQETQVLPVLRVLLAASRTAQHPLDRNTSE